MKNWVDWIILIALVGALIRGYRVGLLSTFFSAIGFIGGGFAGLFAALHYASTWHSNLTKFSLIILAIFIGASVGEVILRRFAKFFHGKILFGPFKWLDSILGAALSVIRALIMVFILGKLLMAMPWGIGHNEIPHSALFKKIEHSAPKISFNLHSLPSAGLLK
jgi:uncharacterized membrane protein required for colicin V production